MSMRANTIPIMHDVITATSNENLAALGCAAPNSFDTLTLHDVIYMFHAYSSVISIYACAYIDQNPKYNIKFTSLKSFYDVK